MRYKSVSRGSNRGEQADLTMRDGGRSPLKRLEFRGPLVAVSHPAVARTADKPDVREFATLAAVEVVPLAGLQHPAVRIENGCTATAGAPAAELAQDRAMPGLHGVRDCATWNEGGQVCVDLVDLRLELEESRAQRRGDGFPDRRGKGCLEVLVTHSGDGNWPVWRSRLRSASRRQSRHGLETWLRLSIQRGDQRINLGVHFSYAAHHLL